MHVATTRVDGQSIRVGDEHFAFDINVSTIGREGLSGAAADKNITTNEGRDTVN